MGWYVSKQALQPALPRGEGSRRAGEGISSAGIAPKTCAWVWVPPLPTRVGSRTASGMKERGFWVPFCGCSSAKVSVATLGHLGGVVSRTSPQRWPAWGGDVLHKAPSCGGFAASRGGGDFEKFATPGFLFPF